ncbi:unnamed protein product, partial [Mesorhabditis belari]|uniref:Splicing factor YJU2 n=1 Tax=Mesorhabditis belari TaxID=2138241 RepID=A0AAF3EDN7_9BILA
MTGTERVRNRQFVQRIMAPFNMQCNTCREYIYKGKKFNMKRETAEGEFYLGLKIFRFYFKCPNCLAEISFKTDLESCDYQMEQGATRLFEAFKLYQQAAKEEEAKEAEDAKDPMKMLEKRTKASKAEMEMSGKLDEIQEQNRQHETINLEDFLNQFDSDRKLTLAERIRLQEEEDEKEIKQLYGRDSDGVIRRRIKDEDEVDNEAHLPTSSALASLKWEADPEQVDVKPNPDGKRSRDSQKDKLSKLIVVKKKKQEVTVKQEIKDEDEHADATSSTGPPKAPPAASALLGLGVYGSSSDSE